MYKIFSLSLSAILISTSSFGLTLECNVLNKYSNKGKYSQANLQKYNPSVKIEFSGDKYYVSRCSYETIAKKITCDKHKMDKAVVDNFTSYIKLYHFSSQFDLQLFADKTFVENNGRASVSYGTCKVTKN
jgi:hypothetical protein